MKNRADDDAASFIVRFGDIQQASLRVKSVPRFANPFSLPLEGQAVSTHADNLEVSLSLSTRKALTPIAALTISPAAMIHDIDSRQTPHDHRQDLG